MTRQPRLLIAAVTMILLSGIPLTSVSAETPTAPVWEQFSEFDPQSEGVIDHSAWSTFLYNSVLVVGRSTKVLGTEQKDTFRLSRIAYGNSSPSRYEGNRLLLHLFKKPDKKFITNYKEGLENLPSRVPLAWLNRDQQLAFWLNLYSATVIEKLAKEYPVARLSQFRKDSDNPSFWNEKILQVEGVQLSLVDIETIVINNWDSPLVVYGLFQGSVGGPRLPGEAYSGKNVWKLLEGNAIEFVNSNRGVRIKKDHAEISLFYQWMAAAFNNSEAEMLLHINQYADFNFLVGISAVTSVKTGYYDWYIADLVGGVLHSGQTTKGNAMAGGSARFLDNVVDGIPARQPSDKYSPLTINFIRGLMLNNDIPNPETVITTVECEPGESCQPEDETS